MSQSSTEGGTDQGSGSQQNGQDQGSGQGNQAQGAGTQQGASNAETYTPPDLSAITDDALRETLLKRDKEAWTNGREAAKYRTERNTLQQQMEQQAEEARRANETEQQRLAREQQERDEKLTKLEKENRDLRVGGAIKAAATGAHDVNLVAELLLPKVTLDDAGTPTNTQTLLTELRAEKPWMFKPGPNQDAGAGNGEGQGVPAGDMNDNIRTMLGARRGRPA
jgi:hypothetical protein